MKRSKDPTTKGFAQLQKALTPHALAQSKLAREQEEEDNRIVDSLPPELLDLLYIEVTIKNAQSSSQIMCEAGGQKGRWAKRLLDLQADIRVTAEGYEIPSDELIKAREAL